MIQDAEKEREKKISHGLVYVCLSMEMQILLMNFFQWANDESFIFCCNDRDIIS